MEAPNDPTLMDLNVLVIDDDPSIHELLDFHLAGLTRRVFHALNPGDGISLAHGAAPDVILLDIKMPGADGFRVFRQLKDHAETCEIPVIFLTADRDPHQIERALNAGGADYVTKPIQEIELRARICAATRARRLVELLRIHASIDALTGLKNRGAFDSSFAATVASYSRNQQPFGLLLLDLDHFKSINDRYGHGVGDEILRQVGSAIERTTRPYDVAARYGGEEFAIILNQTNDSEARQIALRTLETLHQIDVQAAGRSVEISASAGLVYLGRETTAATAEEILRAADTALYEAKNGGLDRLSVSAGPARRSEA